MQNDERAWKHICRKMKQGFASILVQTFSFNKLTDEDLEDIFQESCKFLNFNAFLLYCNELTNRHGHEHEL